MDSSQKVKVIVGLKLDLLTAIGYRQRLKLNICIQATCQIIFGHCDPLRRDFVTVFNISFQISSSTYPSPWG